MQPCPGRETATHPHEHVVRLMRQHAPSDARKQAKLPPRGSARAVGQQRPCLSGKVAGGEHDRKNGKIPLAPSLNVTGVG
jgi:hypothetical protein